MAVATAGIVLTTGLPAALGQPADPAFPSREDVAAARQQAEEAARGVQAIQADYAAADAELDRLGLQAAQAAEEYNGARWRLQQARAEARTARRLADRARTRTTRQRAGIGALVAQTYQGGADLGQVAAYLTSDDPDALLDRFSAFDGASTSMQARLDRFNAAYSLHRVLRSEARRAVAAADRAEQEAAAARQRAEDAVAAQQAALAALEGRKQRLVQELARAQDVSVELAAQRQEALERREELRRRRAAERAAERARRQAAAQAAQRAAEEAAAQAARAAQARAERAERRAEQAQAARDARAQRRQAQAARDRAQAAREAAEAADAAEARQEARREARAARQARREAQAAREAARQAREQRREAREHRREAREQARAERRAAARERQPARASYSGGASQAVAFAMDQIGEPYVWGGAGPDQWDCSGLTSGAWGSAGRSLSHYSVAQYYETSRVGYSDLRPGDLIFWSSNGSPSGIFHVGMYIGNDQMVHAPNSTTTVKVENVWYWQSPDFFGRV